MGNPKGAQRKKGGKTSVGQYNKFCGCGWDGPISQYAAHMKEKHGRRSS